MKNRKALLSQLLQVLLDEWGHEQVTEALRNARSPQHPLTSDAQSSSRPISRRRVKLSAVQQIERAALEREQKELLSQLAARYDQKLFLPSVADVREFLILMGDRPIGMKDRTEAFRVLLPSLMRLPITRLQHLTQTALHSGPSELAPISDAITAVGERLPRLRHTD
ncbi:MAG: hypothetical protein ACJ71U_18555 [Terriglobales bacterium]